MIWELIVNLRLGVSSWFCGLERILRDKEEILGFCWEGYGSKPGIGYRILLYKCKPKRHSRGLANYDLVRELDRFDCKPTGR